MQKRIVFEIDIKSPSGKGRLGGDTVGYCHICVYAEYTDWTQNVKQNTLLIILEIINSNVQPNISYCVCVPCTTMPFIDAASRFVYLYLLQYE